MCQTNPRHRTGLHNNLQSIGSYSCECREKIIRRICAECGVLTTFCNRIIVIARIPVQDSIVTPPSKEITYRKAQLEETAEFVGLRWHGRISSE